MTNSHTTFEPRPDSYETGFREYLNITLVVGLYIGLGFLFHPDPDTYLLTGIPITALFQILVARRPLSELWLRHGQPFVFDRWTVVLLVLFLIGPVQAIMDGIRSGNWPVGIYGVMAIFGALGAAMGFRRLGKSYTLQLGILLLLMIPIGLIRLVILHHSAAFNDPSLGHRFWIMVRSLLFYVPALFVVEEVFFRGALDSYLHRGEHGPGWTSAAYVSVLWGLWHMPIAGPLSITLVGKLIAAQLIMGLILSWFWRQTGNMAMPGTIHAIIDALRNALML